MDATLLARIQFGFTLSFHIVFPALSIGLASYLAVLEALWLKTGEPRYRELYRFWSSAFAVAFGMGVVSGIVMSYEFGTNWSRFSDMAGNVLGPLLSYEVITAFFLEAGFLGIMLFGWGRVGRAGHFLATGMVALGTLISAFWILSANSWMQTPQGYGLVDGRFSPQDWLAVIFNPSFPYRLVHMVLAAYLATAFLVGATGAWHLLRDSRQPAARTMFSMAMWMAVAVAPIQLVVGDLHGLNTLEYQPAKIAAMEGDWETRAGTPFILLGLPDMAREETRWAVELPHLGSLILTHRWNGTVKGLKAWPPEERPFSPLIFWTFRLMVGLGLLMILVGAIGLWLRLRRRLYDSAWFLRFALAMGPSGLVAILAGWITTEVGRQPWIVYGLMRTADGASPVGAGRLTASLAIFVVVYCVVFGTGIYYLLRLLAAGPQPEPPTHEEPRTPMRPLSASDLALDPGE